MIGAVRGVDPRTGHAYDDTKRYLDSFDLDEASRAKIFCDNALRVYPRIAKRLGTASVVGAPFAAGVSGA